MFTILEHGKKFKGMKMAIIGDILYQPGGPQQHRSLDHNWAPMCMWPDP
jgi:hypothetical protein